MKIGLNATCLNDRPSGARQRFIGIYGELMKRLPGAEFVVYEPLDCRVSSWFGGISNISARQTPLPSVGRIRRYLAGLSYWRAALTHEGFNIFEGFHRPLVTAPKAKTLLTIHDIRALRPESAAMERAIFRSVLRKSLEAADHVITVSETVKNEILDFYPNTRISVVYNGLSIQDFTQIQESELSAFREKFGLPEKFLLAVGHFEPRKNYLRLIDAMEILRDRNRASHLLIVGNNSGERALIEERIRSHNLDGQVKILSGLSDLEVRCAYKLCSLFVFPSYYEGFGIPILEAMAAGCPMALSDIPVFREITQNKGAYFRFDDAESMAVVIDEVLSSSNERERQIVYGNERVQMFSFQSLAAQLEQIYRSLT